MSGEVSLDTGRLENVKSQEDGTIQAACPACRAAGSDKSRNHLRIWPDGKYGCAVNPDDATHRREILRLAGKPPERPASTNGSKRIVATYEYTDASGKLLFQAVRYDPKDFRQRQPDGKGSWIWNLKGVELVLFRLPEILHAVANGTPVFICEGEKDVLAIVQRSFDATCNPMGAGKWRDSYTKTLRDADVYIIADKDDAGRNHAHARALLNTCSGNEPARRRGV